MKKCELCEIFALLSKWLIKNELEDSFQKTAVH